jgi:hypothetical protein
MKEDAEDYKMAAKKRTLVDYGLQVLRELLAEKPQDQAQDGGIAPKVANLDDLKLDELRREKIRLEQEERKMLSDLRGIEDQKRKLFEEGVRNPSEREQRARLRKSTCRRKAMTACCRRSPSRCASSTG